MPIFLHRWELPVNYYFATALYFLSPADDVSVDLFDIVYFDTLQKNYGRVFKPS